MSVNLEGFIIEHTVLVPSDLTQDIRGGRPTNMRRLIIGKVSLHKPMTAPSPEAREPHKPRIVSCMKSRDNFRYMDYEIGDV